MVFGFILIATVCLYLFPRFAKAPLLRGLYAAFVVGLLLLTKADYTTFCLSMVLICGCEGRFNADTPRTRREWFFYILALVFIVLTFLPHYLPK